MTTLAIMRGRLARRFGGLDVGEPVRLHGRRGPSPIAIAPCARPGRRILAVLECRPSDDAVLDQAIRAATTSGGFLTLVVIVPKLPMLVNAGPFCVPQPSSEALRSQAETVLRTATAKVPRETPVLTAVEERRTNEAIRRRVSLAAHDLVVVRRRRVTMRPPWWRPGAPLVAVAS